jgi:hypothetical protein
VTPGDLATVADLARLEQKLDRLLAAVSAAREKDEVLSPAEFARRAGVSTCSVYRGVRSGAIPSRKLGRRIVIPSSALRPVTDDEIERLAEEARERKP